MDPSDGLTRPTRLDLLFRGFSDSVVFARYLFLLGTPNDAPPLVLQKGASCSSPIHQSLSMGCLRLPSLGGAGGSWNPPLVCDGATAPQIPRGPVFFVYDCLQCLRTPWLRIVSFIFCQIPMGVVGQYFQAPQSAPRAFYWELWIVFFDLGSVDGYPQASLRGTSLQALKAKTPPQRGGA